MKGELVVARHDPMVGGVTQAPPASHPYGGTALSSPSSYSGPLTFHTCAYPQVYGVAVRHGGGRQAEAGVGLSP